MARPKEGSQARSSGSRPPIPHAAPPGDLRGHDIPFHPRDPTYMGLPGGPNVTIEQLRALRFSREEYDRLAGGPGCELGFL
eukprot:9547149-Heterocapsa_arctica.AAC.1